MTGMRTLLNTIAVEPNRWTKQRIPACDLARDIEQFLNRKSVAASSVLRRRYWPIVLTCGLGGVCALTWLVCRYTGFQPLYVLGCFLVMCLPGVAVAFYVRYRRKQPGERRL